MLTKRFLRRLISEATKSIDVIYKERYSDIPESDFREIISADPTSSDEKMGKYSNWLLGLYKEGNLKKEDLYKASEYLSVYNETPNIFPKLYNIKNLPMLYKILSDGGKIKKQDSFSGEVKPEKDITVHYKDDTWVLLTPNTKEASCKYGAGLFGVQRQRHHITILTHTMRMGPYIYSSIERKMLSGSF